MIFILTFNTLFLVWI